ncbi:MAG: type IV pilus twitching motility protein PilT [Clostridiales bacterium]|nr:type IV pilus twitching motility protein PilT [Clostridiales bacterium]MCF8021137.1 type IV pilus twitching motility protein PilT [Clostridiales bacterium]
MEIMKILDRACELGVSDVHLGEGYPPAFRLHGELLPLGAPEWQAYDLKLDEKEELTGEDIDNFCRGIMNEEQYYEFMQAGEYDLAFSLPGAGRFRVNVFKQRGTLSAAIRIINHHILTIEELGLPGTLAHLAQKSRGLVLVTGPTGSGKSTTLAAMIDLINSNYRCHIITLEDPIEFVHTRKKSIINQREIKKDTYSFAMGLRASLREDPDVILVGEMRDEETISTAITAAETGHLVFATLHTSSAAQTIDRIIDVFPPHQQQQIKTQLSGTLQGIIAQHLISRADKSGRVAALEIMISTPAISNLIREGKTHQILSQIQTGSKYGMQTLDMSLQQLYRDQVISREDAGTANEL